MFEDQFSRTAVTAAALRAAHQIAENGLVFTDPLALRILGGDLPELLPRYAEDAIRPLRLFIALRSRIAEDVARRAIAAGTRQIVVLGAGLDTFGCRAPEADGLALYEVDHPATQEEKRRRLAGAGIAPSPSLRFAPCDFERQSLAEALAAAGFDPHARTVVNCLGVAPYLTGAAFEALLDFVAGLDGGADLTFDYANPPQSIESPGHRLFHERMAARVAGLGESFRSYFDTAELHDLLRAGGFETIEDVGPREIAQVLAPKAPPPPAQGGHILHAAFGRR